MGVIDTAGVKIAGVAVSSVEIAGLGIPGVDIPRRSLMSWDSKSTPEEGLGPLRYCVASGREAGGVKSSVVDGWHAREEEGIFVGIAIFGNSSPGNTAIAMNARGHTTKLPTLRQ